MTKGGGSGVWGRGSEVWGGGVFWERAPRARLDVVPNMDHRGRGVEW